LRHFQLQLFSLQLILKWDYVQGIAILILNYIWEYLMLEDLFMIDGMAGGLEWREDWNGGRIEFESGLGLVIGTTC